MIAVLLTGLLVRMLAPCWLEGSTSRSRPLRSQLARRGWTEELAKAATTNSPPPDWIRLATTVEGEEAVQEVAAAVADVSEGLSLQRQQVRVITRRDPDGKDCWSLVVHVPPKATLLVSSMVGEALFRVDVNQPMVLAEGLELDGEVEFFRVELASPEGLEASLALSKSIVQQRLAAQAEVAEDGRISLHTTAAGRKALQQWLPTKGIDVEKLIWIPLGGNADYFEWVAEQVAPPEELVGVS